MRWALLVSLVASVALGDDHPGRFRRFCTRTDQGRTERGFDCGGALFEAFPASGAGTTGVCSTTAPTGAKGEVLTFTRATNATCTSGVDGTRTTGIADGALTEMAPGQLRQEFDPSGVIEARVEFAATNALVRFIDLTNAAWADVGVPVVTGSKASPWTGTFTASAVQIDDDAAGAFEGRSQAVTVSAGAAYTMHCYLKGVGANAKARLSLDGTTGDISTLTTTDWSILTVTDASSSGVSISAQVLVGNAASDTGSIIVGGCQVEAGSWRTSIIPTVATAVTRNADFGYFTTPATSVGSLAATVTTMGGFVSNARVIDATNVATANVSLYIEGGTVAKPAHIIQNNGGSKDLTGTGTVAPFATTRVAGWLIPSSTIAVIAGGTETQSSVGVQAAVTGVTRVYLAYSGGTGFEIGGLVGRLCVDPDISRCR